jgi:hypothetical protein
MDLDKMLINPEKRKNQPDLVKRVFDIEINTLPYLTDSDLKEYDILQGVYVKQY